MNLQQLYQQMILDHNKHPKNFGDLKYATHQADGFNPLCGDHYLLKLILNDATISDIAFTGQGCAISKASASILTTLAKGKTKKEALALFADFKQLLQGQTGEKFPQEFMVFKGVAQFPARVKCASLAWHTLKAALAG